MTGGMSPAGAADDPTAPGDLAPRGESLGQLRASHQDRDRVVEVLRVAAGDGRLTAEELDERLEVALTARTYAELAALTADLPAGAGPAAAVAVPEPKDVVRIDVGSGSTKRDGRWVVPRRMEVRVTSGGVKLDFTEAVIAETSLTVDADVHSGSLTLVTKPGIVVDADGVAIKSGSVKVRAPWGRDVPVSLRIEVTGQVRSGSVTARPARRTFWQWLARRPATWAAASPSHPERAA
jgi:hypothetical protein